MNPSKPARLFSNGLGYSEEDVVEINEHLWFVDQDGFRVVFQGWNTPLYRMALNDEVQLRFVSVALRQSGLARQSQIGRAFGHTEVTQRHWERRFEQEGLEGLRRRARSGRPRKVTDSQETCTRKWFQEGVSNREIARRLGIGETTVRRMLARMNLFRESSQKWTEEECLPFAEREGDAGCRTSVERNEQREEAADTACATGEEDTICLAGEQEEHDEDAAQERPWSSSWKPDPMDRSLDRLMARLGRLEDAEPIFGDVERLPGAGVLLAIPFLVKSGLLNVFAEVYRTIGPAFYGLRTTVVCMFFLALLRIKRPENLKEHHPPDLGRLLGLDRAPEVKTLRRKLQVLAGREQGLVLMRRLAEERARQRPDAIGVLYFDGHVKSYHGKYAVGKAYITQRRLAAPASTDTWVNDLHGEPWFVVPSDRNEGLSRVLEPALSEVRELVGGDRKITVVFDRGGWSPKLFSRWISKGFHIITYKRGASAKLPQSQFEERSLEAAGRKCHDRLHDAARVRVGRIRRKSEKGKQYLWMRRVTCLRSDGRQTVVLTDRMDLPAERVLDWMFRRWRQENFFKYMGDEFALDALLEYGVEPLKEGTDVPNPERRKLDKKLAKARQELVEAERCLGECLDANEESRRRTVRGFKIAHSEFLRRVQEAHDEIEKLIQQRSRLPKRVPGTEQKTLKKERKLIADSVKMTAYQVETDLLGLLSEMYARTEDEGRTLLHAAFQSRGQIEVTGKDLRVTLAPQSSPHRSRAVAALCELLNETGACFPGTERRLRFACEVPEPVNL